MKLKRREMEWRWELEAKKMTIPTVAEIAKKEGLSWEEAAKKCAIICGNAHKNNDSDCFRKQNGHKLCDGCPKYQPKKTETIDYSEWGMRVRAIPTQHKLVSKRR